jgi:hypothetical protein
MMGIASGAANCPDDWGFSWQKHDKLYGIFKNYRREDKDDGGRPYPEL